MIRDLDTQIVSFYDNVPPRAAVVETYMPRGAACVFGGYLFMTPEFAAKQEPADTTATIYGNSYPAWSFT